MSDVSSKGAGESAGSMGRDPRKCAGHRSDGEPCEKWAIKGMRVCRTHGGAAPQVRAAAERRQAEAAARRVLAELSVEPVTDPFTALMRLAGQVVSWQEATAALVNELESVRYRGANGAERLRAEVGLYERAMDRAVAVLAAIAKLGIEERLVRVTERQGALVAQVIRAILGELQLTPEQWARVSEVVPRHLRALSANGGA